MMFKKLLFDDFESILLQKVHYLRIIFQDKNSAKSLEIVIQTGNYQVIQNLPAFKTNLNFKTEIACFLRLKEI